MKKRTVFHRGSSYFITMDRRREDDTIAVLEARFVSPSHWVVLRPRRETKRQWDFRYARGTWWDAYAHQDVLCNFRHVLGAAERAIKCVAYFEDRT